MKNNSNKLDEFTRAYLICALWSSTVDQVPLDDNYSISDFAPDALEKAIKDCAKFQKENGLDITKAELDFARAGHNFWLNRNGHGSSFWDEYSQGDVRHIYCERLDKASRAFKEIDCYPGDDGKIYFD